MCKFFDKEDADNISRLNEALGSKHRTKPYDLTNPDDLSHMLLFTIAAFRDYNHYCLELDNLAENMDESLEYYDPATWINMSINPEKTDDLAIDAIESLGNTADLFLQLSQRAEKNLAGVLEIMLSCPCNIQTKVLGGHYTVSEDKLDYTISMLLDKATELEYHYNMEENRDEFLKLLNTVLGDTPI